MHRPRVPALRSLPRAARRASLFVALALALPGCVPGGGSGGGDDDPPDDGRAGDLGADLGGALDGGPGPGDGDLPDGERPDDGLLDGGPLDGALADGALTDGAPRDLGPAPDQGACADGDTDRVACGLNDRGEQPRACVGGAWLDDGPCDDPDVCVDGMIDARACLGSGVEERTCVEGAYTPYGPCQGGCVDECAPGDPICVGDAVAPCVDVDDDPCLERAPARPCAEGLACREGACVELPAVIINEVFYDQVGADGTEVFIELWGPPGASVDDLTLYGVNGNGGVDYARMPLDGVIGPDGYYLVVDADANPALRGISDYGSAVADLQNGPDALQLRRGDVVIDAVHYGEGGDFAGEGAPAVDPPEGQSITRLRHVDTDDNAADFTAAAPTPGGEPAP